METCPYRRLRVGRKTLTNPMKIHLHSSLYSTSSNMCICNSFQYAPVCSLHSESAVHLLRQLTTKRYIALFPFLYRFYCCSSW